MIGNEHRDDARKKSGGMTRRSALRRVATGAGGQAVQRAAPTDDAVFVRDHHSTPCFIWSAR